MLMNEWALSPCFPAGDFEKLKSLDDPGRTNEIVEYIR